MRATTPPSSIELWTFRVLCLLGGLGLPLLGYTYLLADGDFVDPLWLRWLLGSLPLGLVVASFVSGDVRREMSGLTSVLLYVLAVWFATMLAVNRLAPEYAVGAFAIIVGVAVVGSAGYNRLWILGVAMSFSVGAMVIVTFLVQQPGVDRFVFTGSLIGCGGALFVGAWMQHRLRDRLSESESRYRTVFERVGDGVLLLSVPDLHIVATNDAYRHLTGYSRQELGGRTLYDLSGARRDEIERDLQRVLEKGRVDLGERRHRCRDGSFIDVDVGFARIPDANDVLLCMTMRDLTEEKRVRHQIEVARDQAQSMLDLRTAFLNNMSHELRTPLVSLTGFLDLLEEDDAHLDAEERLEMVRSLRRSADRLNQTLNAVLDLAQIESGHFELNPEPVDMNRAAEDAADLLRPMAREKGLELHFKATDPARVLVDQPALHRILLNLFSNAIKFTPSGGITITVEADSHRVFLHVRDTGVGIDPSFLPHLFGAFRQASSGLSREHEGSGLGLTITKRLLDLMGGRIRVDSSPGDGTCISIVFARTWAMPELPARSDLDGELEVDENGEAPEPDARPADTYSIAPLAARPRALIVEDNMDTGRLMERMLAEHFDVAIAPEARTALRFARGAWYDVLLIDIHLGPGMNGTELLAKLRGISAYTHVPAVAVTAYNSSGDRERFLSMGFDAYLAKPFTRKQLIAAAEAAHASRSMAAS